MKHIFSCGLLIFIFLCKFYLQVDAQDQITSVAPSSVYPGQSTDIIIHGLGTSFKSGVTTLNFGPGITVSRSTIINSETIDAYVTVSNSASTGFNDLTVTTGNDIIVKHAAIQIFSLGSGVQASIIVSPAQSIHLSDFDPNNVANAPLLFTVTVYNSSVVQNLTVIFTLSGQKYGLIGTATKKYLNEKANNIETLTNRQFDKYQVSNTNNTAIQSAIQNGTLPADVYDYHIQVLDDKNNELATADGTNTIINQQNKPELISPGSAFTSEPEFIHTKQPLFQWFAQANSVNLNLFEVNSGQTSSAAVSINRPIFTMNDIIGSNLLYPAGAPLLEDGHTYAWQITANYTSATGSTTLVSDMFWFTVSSSGSLDKHSVSQITIIPNEVTIASGKSCSFKVKAFDANNDTVQIKPIWTVVPGDGGTIDQNGNFTANNNEPSVAIVASYGDIKDYATVYISPAIGANGQLWDVNATMRQIFGLPAR